uniref:Uncharacterized protein n=1 Tax=Rhizophora mucronata TaxID=61149 RepID=A0A2P2N4V6_RHIMU
METRQPRIPCPLRITLSHKRNIKIDPSSHFTTTMFSFNGMINKT